MYSICRIATLHIKMHVFYMPDCHVAHKNAYILYRGCAGGFQGDPGHPGGSRRSWEQKGHKTIVFYSRKWRDRPFRVHETSATITKHRKNAVEHRWAAAGDKWCMATGKGRNLEETIGKARGTRYKVQGIRKSSKAATDGA